MNSEKFRINLSMAGVLPHSHRDSLPATLTNHLFIIEAGNWQIMPELTCRFAWDAGGIRFDRALVRQIHETPGLSKILLLDSTGSLMTRCRFVAPTSGQEKISNATLRKR